MDQLGHDLESIRVAAEGEVPADEESQRAFLIRLLSARKTQFEQFSAHNSSHRLDQLWI